MGMKNKTQSWNQNQNQNQSWTRTRTQSTGLWSDVVQPPLRVMLRSPEDSEPTELFGPRVEEACPPREEQSWWGGGGLSQPPRCRSH